MHQQLLLPTTHIAGLLPPREMTHEEFISNIKALGIARLSSEDSRAKLHAAKFTYGVGDNGARASLTSAFGTMATLMTS